MRYNQVPLELPLTGSSFLRPDGRSFWAFLRSNGIRYSQSDFPFLTRHHKPRIKPVFSAREYFRLSSRGEALAYLYQGLGRSLVYVGPVLDLEMEHGFNDHTDRHTLWVSQTGVELLQRAGLSHRGGGCYDALTEVMMTLVGMTHDLGNFFSRSDHSTYSAWLLTRLFGDWQAERELFLDALYAILFHEEPVLVGLKQPLVKGTPLQWALIAADKMHVGRDRIGGRSYESGVKHNALEDDTHILLNALIVRSSWHLGVESFVWDLDFSVEQLVEKFKAFSKGDNHRIWMPSFVHKLFLKGGRKYRDTYADLFRHVYKDRMNLAAEAVFLLFPYLKKFQVTLTDNDVRNKVGSGELLVWERLKK